MSQLDEFFQFLKSKIHEKEDLQNFVKNWVGRYHGKVLQVITDEGKKYVVITPYEPYMEVREGIYPSPDVIYKASVTTLMGIFTGETPFKKVMKSGELEVIGNAHESDPLANLILQAMMSL